MKEINHYEKLLREYIESKVDAVLKAPAHYLRHPFVDPGSVYDGNLWDWDSFWAVYALLNMANDDNRERYLMHARGNVYNFLDYQMDDGYIPMMITKSDLPEPYLIGKRKEGHITNMHKPFLCQQIALISGYSGDYQWIEPHLDAVEKYFACYDEFYYHSNSGLYVWADDVMIGVDNDPATFGRPRFSTANIYLNSFMVSELRAMAGILQKLGKPHQHYEEKAQRLTASIQAECWDPRDKFFYSVDVDVKTRAYDWFHRGLGVFWETLPIKVRVWSGFIPLWAGVADQNQAALLTHLHIKDNNTFNSDYGVTTLAKDEKMFNLSVTINPSNWLGPIWTVANYVVFRGLMKYGFVQEAEEMCRKTVKLLGQGLERTGTLHEYYDPATGEPITNGGFMNWNMLVLNMIDEVKGKPPFSIYL